MVRKVSIIKRPKEKVLLRFLKRTSEGEYAPIEKSSLNFIRIKEETDNIDPNEERYYYSID